MLVARADGLGRVARAGLDQHRNWWPDLYREACAHWKIDPDPAVLGYATTYESVRADLKTISASA